MELPLLQQARSHRDRTAVIAKDGTFTYEELLDASECRAAHLLGSRTDLEEARVAFLVPPSFEYVATQWGIWRAGGVAVPLAVSHPATELRYVIADADASVIITHPDLEETARDAIDSPQRHLVSTKEFGDPAHATLPALDKERRAMMVYTSGTTGKPRGVVTTHANINAQVTSLIDAWEWRQDDHILLALPLHHVHGIIAVLTCAMWAGACCEMLPDFDAAEVWNRFEKSRPTVFMAVPTIYRRLIDVWEDATAERRQSMSDACRRMRLHVSGSAALPVPVLERWRAVTGHTLLERYGMTEIGMGLTNPLHGKRTPGHVGTPFPGVEVRLMDDNGREPSPGSPGEIEARGPNVFLEYWRRPDETASAFRDGWFATGDIAVVEDGGYRLLGRKSVDIINTAGYKVSALEIEEALRSHPSIDECAVVGVADPDLGERVCAAVELGSNDELTIETLREWARDRLAPYKIPRDLRVAELPRNAMGKVMKVEVAALFHEGRKDGRTE
ncbi:MAG: acyl-CoA synthetase [Gemmatimonadetes bacterium]|nr:acyl-CoA synthetase [Gemmatimonadota bacterium]